MNHNESIKCTDIVKQLSGREIPESLDIKTGWIKDFLISEKHCFAVTGMLLASARRDNFKDNKSGWVQWAEENFDLEISERSHRNKFGTILISIPENNRLDFDRLFKLDKDKAQAISRFIRRENLDEVKSTEIKDVLVFLAEHHLEHMTREEVREAVDEKLGTVKEKKPVFKVQQPELPGFKESINNIFKSLNQGSIKTFVETLTHDEAKQATSVAITCLNGVSAFYRKTGDYKHLTVSELNELEAYTNKLCKQFGVWRAELATTDLKAG